MLPPPEVYRLPRSGERDPYHGLTRSYYYEAEKAGLLKLIRLRKIGNMRGVTLVPYRAVADLIKQAAEGGSEEGKLDAKSTYEAP